MTSFYGGGGSSTVTNYSPPGAMIFKGIIGSIGDGATITALPDEHIAGWTYLVVTADVYAGEVCEIGDFIVCITDGTLASDLDWKIVQRNILNLALPEISQDDIGKAVAAADGKYILQSLEFLSNKGDSSDNDYSFNIVTVNELNIGQNSKIKFKENKLSVVNAKDEYTTLRGADPKDNNDFTPQRYIKQNCVPIEASIRPIANGNPAVCEDSIAQSFQELKIYGKSTQTSSQLLPLTESSYSANGLTATLQDDGSLIVNGTPGSSFTNLIYIPLSLSPGDYYIAGGENTAGHAVAFIVTTKSTGTNYWANQSFSVDGTETSIVFTLQSNFANAINNYRVPAMLNKGTEPLPVQSYTPTSESPVPILNTGDGGSVESTITNGNICPTSSGTTNFQTDCFVLAGVQYTICAKQSALVGFRIQIRDADNSAIESIAIYDHNTTWKDSGYAAFTPTHSGKVFINSFAQCEWSELAIYVGALTARQYDTYQSQSFSISTPTGLPGIPVTSGGNYTDSTGQQLVCCYADCLEGKIHYPIKKYYASELHFILNERWTELNNDFALAYARLANSKPVGFALSNTFDSIEYTEFVSSLDRPIIMVQTTFGESVLYVAIKKTALNEVSTNGINQYLSDIQAEFIAANTNPNETSDMSDEEIVAYRALVTYPGTTVVSTNENVAGIEARYIADGDEYIEMMRNKAKASTEFVNIMLGI